MAWLINFLRRTPAPQTPRTVRRLARDQYDDAARELGGEGIE